MDNKPFISYTFVRLSVPTHHAITVVRAIERIQAGQDLDKEEMKQLKRIAIRLREDIDLTENNKGSPIGMEV